MRSPEPRENHRHDIVIRGRNSAEVLEQSDRIREEIQTVLGDRCRISMEGNTLKLTIFPNSISLGEMGSIQGAIYDILDEVGVLEMRDILLYVVPEKKSVQKRIESILERIRNLPDVAEATLVDEYLFIKLKQDKRRSQESTHEIRKVLNGWKELGPKDPESISIVTGQRLKESLQQNDRSLFDLKEKLQSVSRNIEYGAPTDEQCLRIAESIIEAAQSWTFSEGEKSWEKFDREVMLLSQNVFMKVADQEVRTSLLQIRTLEDALTLKTKGMIQSPQRKEQAGKIANDVAARYIRILLIAHGGVDQKPNLNILLSAEVQRKEKEIQDQLSWVAAYPEYSEFISRVGQKPVKREDVTEELMKRFLEIKNKQLNLESYVRHVSTHGKYKIISITNLCYLKIEPNEEMPHLSEELLRKEREAGTIHDVDPKSVTPWSNGEIRGVEAE